MTPAAISNLPELASHTLRRRARSSHSQSFALALLTTFIAVALVGPLRAESILDAIGAEVQSIYEKSKGSLVRVKAEPATDGQTRMGTGFFISTDGKLLTTAAVARESKRVWIHWQNEELTAEIVGSDQRANLALLQVAGNENKKRKFPALPMGDSTELKIGSAVVAMGNPYDLAPSPSFGIVEGFDLHRLTKLFVTSHIRADIPLSPGESGGPLLNTRGEVVGILVAAAEQSFPSYALPIHAVQRLLPDFEKDGRAHYGWMGISILECPREGRAGEGAGNCIKVQHVFSNTPAALVGIQPHDRIVKVGDKPVNHLADMLDVSFAARIGDKLELLVQRQAMLTNFVVEVVEHPQHRRAAKAVPASQAE